MKGMIVGQTIELQIEALGSQGDGIGESAGKKIYVPFTVPGDRVKILVQKGKRTKILERLADGPERKSAACRYFEKCGGCTMQHLSSKIYSKWKKDNLLNSLRRQKIKIPALQPIVSVKPGTRRRVRLHFCATQSGVIVGFNSARSHKIISIDACPLLTNRITQLIAPLRTVLNTCQQIGTRGELALTDTDNGIDLTIVTKQEPDLQIRNLLIDLAGKHDLARVSWRPRKSYSQN